MKTKIQFNFTIFYSKSKSKDTICCWKMPLFIFNRMIWHQMDDEIDSSDLIRIKRVLHFPNDICYFLSNSCHSFEAYDDAKTRERKRDQQVNRVFKCNIDEVRTIFEATWMHQASTGFLLLLAHLHCPNTFRCFCSCDSVLHIYLEKSH